MNRMKQTPITMGLSLLLCVLLLLGLCPSGLAEGEAPEEAALTEAEADGGESTQRDDWETRLLLMLQEHDANPETVGAGYYNLVTGEEHYYNGDQYRVSGSMYKVPLNMLFLNWIDEGKLTMDDSVGGYRYAQLLEGTIIDSNNDYARMLWDYAGATIETNPASTFYHRYRILIAPLMGEDPDNVDDKYYENNFFTPRQVISCLRQLYEGREKYDRLIETMQRAEPEKYFKLRERRFNIAHKYGWFAEDPVLYLNDCALCFTDDPIAIVLFTSGTENAYSVLTDYCTLMCDYAQEKHEERIAREQEEADAAALQAERDRLAAEAAATAAAASTAEPAGESRPAAETENREPQPAARRADADWLHELTLGPIICMGLILAGTLAAVIWFALRRRSGRLNLWYGLGAILFAALAMILCFPGMSGWSYVAEQEEDPREVIEDFFTAMKSGDREAADACLTSGAESGLTTLPTDEMHAAVREALRESWDFSFLGDCSSEKASAWQEIQLRVLDFSRMEKQLQTETRIQLLELARTMDRESVYDEDGNYRPEVAGMAYDQAMVSLLQQPQDYYGSVGVRVELALTKGGWKIVPTKALVSALTGSLA